MSDFNNNNLKSSFELTLSRIEVRSYLTNKKVTFIILGVSSFIVLLLIIFSFVYVKQLDPQYDPNIPNTTANWNNNYLNIVWPLVLIFSIIINLIVASKTNKIKIETKNSINNLDELNSTKYLKQLKKLLVIDIPKNISISNYTKQLLDYVKNNKLTNDLEQDKTNNNQNQDESQDNQK